MKSTKAAFTLAVIAMAAMSEMQGAHAAVPHPDRGSMPAAASAPHEGFGVLKAVNPVTGEVKIAHGPIATLHWPAMTMWFKAQGHLQEDLKVGDNVRFELKQVKPEEWVITRIERKQ